MLEGHLWFPVQRLETTGVLVNICFKIKVVKFNSFGHLVRMEMDRVT